MAELAMGAEPSLWLPLWSLCIVTVTQEEWESASAEMRALAAFVFYAWFPVLVTLAV